MLREAEKIKRGLGALTIALIATVGVSTSAQALVAMVVVPNNQGAALAMSGRDPGSVQATHPTVPSRLHLAANSVTVAAAPVDAQLQADKLKPKPEKLPGDMFDPKAKPVPKKLPGDMFDPKAKPKPEKLPGDMFDPKANPVPKPSR